MDIYSPRGKQAANLAASEVHRINEKYPITLVPFLDAYPVRYDGYVIKDGYIRAAYEIRTRNAPVIDGHLIYKGEHKFDTLLITKDKIDECVRMCSEQKISFYLIMKFLNCTLLWKVSDESGAFLFPMETQIKKTRKSINGGTAKRENYLIPFAKAITLFSDAH